jgi:hypothetical protein
MSLTSVPQHTSDRRFCNFQATGEQLQRLIIALEAAITEFPQLQKTKYNFALPVTDTGTCSVCALGAVTVLQHQRSGYFYVPEPGSFHTEFDTFWNQAVATEYANNLYNDFSNAGRIISKLNDSYCTSFAAVAACAKIALQLLEEDPNKHFYVADLCMLAYSKYKDQLAATAFERSI